MFVSVGDALFGGDEFHLHCQLLFFGGVDERFDLNRGVDTEAHLEAIEKYRFVGMKLVIGQKDPGHELENFLAGFLIHDQRA